MLTKKQFIQAIEQLQEMKDISHKISDALQLLETDFNGFFLGKVEDYYVQLLIDAMELKCYKDDTVSDIISYFIYELDFGKKDMAKNCITLKNNKKISLQTSEQLYNYILKYEK